MQRSAWLFLPLALALAHATLAADTAAPAGPDGPSAAGATQGAGAPAPSGPGAASLGPGSSQARANASAPPASAQVTGGKPAATNLPLPLAAPPAPPPGANTSAAPPAANPSVPPGAASTPAPTAAISPPTNPRPAATGAAEQPAQPPNAVQNVAPEDAEAILGQRIFDAKGDTLGRLIDVLVDAAGQPRAAVIDFGGFMGVGNRKVAVHWSLLRFNPADPVKKIVVDMTPDDIKSAPEYRSPNQAAPVITPTDAAIPAAAEKR